MFISRLAWEQDNGNDDTIEHTIVDPTWDDIQECLSRLDGQTYPAFSLSRGDPSLSFPVMIVLGGPDEYAVELEREPANGRGMFERLQLINPARFNEFGSQGWRGIGKSYHNYEVDLEDLTPDRELVIATIQHFAFTGQWYARAPFVVEAEDEEGLWRRYLP